ncbi:MAG TPA: apolipoprotein N-acyltransferase [Casimicrobiaceae bacterium]|jgi:apolipoprotein N-acyltransferase|nr:apolipoprotein N-acyltransferase [Casimicrobiaceae bacterium]
MAAGAALLLGIASVFGFAPFGAWAVSLLALAGLFALWQRAATPQAAAWIGYAYGIGLFVAGTSWTYVALSTFGGMIPILAAIGTASFCAYLALFPALAGWVTARLAPAGSPARLAIAAAAWTVAEWLHSNGYPGFPWLATGYAQVGGPLAGFAPIGGTFLVGLAVAASAALLVYTTASLERRRYLSSVIAAAAIASIAGGGIALAEIEWTQPSGEPITVSLVQGNIDQDVKFDPAYRENSLAIYAELAGRAKGRLIVLPESALPMFADEVPDELIERLRTAAVRNGGDLLTGLFFVEPREGEEDEDRYYNSVVSIGTAPTQIYRKHHLVPFGESIPAKPVVGWLIRRVLAIPLADQTPGPAYPQPMEVAGQRLAVNICYEDAFGGELIRQLPSATLLVNFTNDAWYGRSLAAEQHAQMSAMRATEAGRPMLRATNTGITSIIDHHGVERARLPWFTRGVLEGSIAGRVGATPYVRFGDAIALGAALLVIAIAVAAVRLRRRASAG